MLDCQLFGLDPFRHHLTNLLFHIANTLLLFWILKRMTGGIWRSAFVAAVFAVHPLNVETVAWVAERKNVLSGFFWMLTIAVYIRYAERPGAGRLLAVFLIYGLSILTKPMVVSLPFVLLLLDYWPLGRFQWGHQGEAVHLPQCESAKLGGQKLSAWHLIREKIPLFILAAVLSVITFVAQRGEGVMAIRERLPINLRIANAAVSYVSYIGKMVYPARLAVLYPLPREGLLSWKPVASILLLIGVSAAIVYKFRGHRYLTVGWLWYLGVLVPVIGLIQVGVQSMADRYAYLALIGIFILVSWGAGEIFGQAPYRKVGLGISAGLILVIFSLCTRAQLRYWRNSVALYDHALTVTKNNPIMHYNLGTELKAQDKVDEAIEHFHKALQLRPAYAEAHNNLGLAYVKKGELESAIQSFRMAVQLKPDAPFAINIGLALKKQGKVDEAIKQWEELLWTNPDCAEAHYNIAIAMIEQGELDGAIEHFADAIRIEPGRANVHNDFGVALFGKNRIYEAIEAFKKAILLYPDYAEAHDNLAEVLYKQGDVDGAIDHWTEVLRLEPNWPRPLKNLAWVRATHKNPRFRNPVQAVELAKRACEVTRYERPHLLDVLAAAYAAADEFTQAVKTAEKAIELAKKAKQEKMAEDIGSRLELYKANKPYICSD
jgi:tetratricopeptide (TPR) repeat protein